MKATPYRPPGRGPFRADQIRPGDPYELSDGHAIVSEPSGRRHGRRHLLGGAVLATDPAVEEAGVEVGHVLDEATLRAPDVSVGGVLDEPGYAHSAPRLAVEYVERGGDEADLAREVAELLRAGTELVWLVRLSGDRRVEVHRAGEAGVVKHAGEVFEAPGILRNAVPVEALPPARLLKTGQTTSYGAGTDGDLEVGIAQDLVDNGDGTIHDRDDHYSWGSITGPYTMNGTVTTFLVTLNTVAGGDAGYTDWRLPTVTELFSIVDHEAFCPAVSAEFNTACGYTCTVLTCSCTHSSDYWSSTTDSASPGFAWRVNFVTGQVWVFPKDTFFLVRAVRGGS